MKRIIITLLVSLTVCIAVPLSAMATDYMAIYAGSFSPGGDYPETAEDGGDFGLAYYGGNDGIGFAIGMHGYDTTAPSFIGDIDVSVVGFEGLITFQPSPSSLQPYAGLGIGSYTITLESGGYSDTGSGAGVILEAGIRLFFDESTFFGVMVKGFTNVYEDPENPDSTFDFGGASSNIVVGFSF